MLEFRVEWQEAPGITTPHLAATWARLEVRCGDRPVTQFWSLRGNSVRPAIYSSVFPLVSWIVRHWWHLLHEGLRAPGLAVGARRGSTRAHRDWMSRHGLFFAREGMAYPDLSIYRQGHEVALHWISDPQQTWWAGRFIGDGFELLPRQAVMAAFTQLIETVMERLDGVRGDEVCELAEEWDAIRNADEHELTLCGRLAALGMDPYDPDGDGAFEEALADLAMPTGMLRDLLDASSPEHLLDDASAAERLASALPSAPANGRRLLEVPVDPRPYVTGYARAQRLRQELKEPADGVPGLERLLESIGADEPTWMKLDDASVIVDGVIQLSGRPAMSATARSGEAKRFLVARALHHWYFVPGDVSNLRLLSRSNDWEQAASRAFAAELLAPAAALEEKLRGASWDYEEELAEQFKVSRMVIAHQIENHGLA